MVAGYVGWSTEPELNRITNTQSCMLRIELSKEKGVLSGNFIAERQINR